MIVSNLTLLIIFCVLIIIGISIVYFSKARIDNNENKIYKLLLIINLIGLILQFLCDFVSYKYNVVPKIVSLLCFRIYLVYFIVFALMILKYVYEITYGNNKMMNIFLWVSTFVSTTITFILPIQLYRDVANRIYYTYGDSVQFIFLLSGLLTTVMFILLLIKRRVVSQKKATPIYLFIAFGLVSMIVQMSHPELVITTAAETFVCLVMYFTIENPDVRLVEYEKREKELAVSANEAKSAFLSSMSHELRTPLNAIVGLSEDIATYQDRVPPEVKEDSNDIINASNTLLEIIGNILDISKIEGGKLELVEADYLPKEEIESLLKIMRTKVEEKDLVLNVVMDPNIPDCLYGDRLRIKQIINNFLSNAIKYTEKGSITFGVRWINNSLEIRVADTGRGIKPEDKDKLFEKFERLHVEKTSSVQGTGLGLAITKNLVELMGGTITVDSVWGQGSTFDVIIPQKLGNKANIVREALSVEEKHDIDYTGKKVLIVDDNKLNIKVLRKAIASCNFEIDECYDGQTAINMINAKPYDLVFMDIMMPIMGGEEAMGILKQNPAFTTPVIALTADATTGAKERYLACGFVDYLAKPFSRDVVATKLEKILGNTK